MLVPKPALIYSGGRFNLENDGMFQPLRLSAEKSYKPSCRRKLTCIVATGGGVLGTSLFKLKLKRGPIIIANNYLAKR